MKSTLSEALFATAALLLACAAAWLAPQAFVPLKPLITPALGLVMFGMGLTLTGAQLAAVLRHPRWLLLGIGLQFVIMPTLAFVIAGRLGLSAPLAAGLILVGACPGGTASNVMTYLARGDVALSVAMTAASTLIAPLATPWLTLWLAGARVDVPALAMLAEILRIVLLPVLAGMLLRWCLEGVARRLARWLPGLAMLLVALIVAIILALNRPRLAATGTLVAGAVVLHNGLGFVLGYVGAALGGARPAQRRAIAIEVGMQNSGLATALALKFLPPLAALPAALFSVWQNLAALGLAAVWRRRR
ncbi:bile acid:sodium symporter family protein [Immundisolibacter sp.]|uniref:bile acid:sodium symporter family protein n=1 Tax=Immundisolibacter sp. TaxID=1934948 RepID=UPI0026370D85|nr:bile acid:sodium symporter family protein [Immundisolibacter sp.]MDD3650856.1 bile acid:sodium symporter family protein [Immundisolibacter sp.]